MTARAERRRAERASKKGHAPLDSGTTQEIRLQNPVAEHFSAFIFGNATMCDRVVQQNSAEGQHLVLCGAGPSLKEHADEWCPKGDQVWGCNSAVTYLAANGYKPTHGFTVDQTPQMLEEWASAPPVEYLLASSVHPHLTEYLTAKGRGITFFHNYVGLKGAPVSYSMCLAEGCNGTGDTDATACAKCGGTELRSATASYEDWFYSAMYPPTIRAGSGLNAVNRAIDVALFMGFAKITVLGADCALTVKRPKPDNAPMGSPAHLAWLREHVVMHADGGHALASGATPVTMEGTIDGRLWLTKPDMCISAVWLEKARQAYPDHIEIIGDTLPNALRGKSDAFLKKLPSLVDARGKPIGFT